MFGKWGLFMPELRELALKSEIKEMETLLHTAGLRMEAGLQYRCGAYEAGRMIACGGYEGATIKCLAVAPEWRGEALLNTIVSHLYTRIRNAGEEEVFIFTVPGNILLFQSLGFSPLAEAGGAALLTNRPEGIKNYLEGIRRLPATLSHHGGACSKPIGAIIMNANPFTRGHQYLAEVAANATALLYIFILQEDKSEFPFSTRLTLARAGTAHLPNVRVHAGGRYMISAATFPSYFLKDPGGAAAAYAALDLTLFAARIAPALHITARFVGEEPLDPLTELYNETMLRLLPQHGIDVHILPRKAYAGEPISASRVRRLIQEGRLDEAQALLPYEITPNIIP